MNRDVFKKMIRKNILTIFSRNYIKIIRKKKKL